MSEAEYRSPDLDLVGAEHVRRYRETGGEVGYELERGHRTPPHHHGTSQWEPQDVCLDLRPPR